MPLFNMKHCLTIFLFNINAFDSNAQNYCYQGGNGDGVASRKLYIQPLSSIQNIKEIQYTLIQNILSNVDDKTMHIKLYNLLGKKIYDAIVLPHAVLELPLESNEIYLLELQNDSYSTIVKISL